MPELQPPPWPAEAPGGRIAAGLQSWVKACPRPLVLFLDEIDALQGEALVAVLRQIRAGYPRRPDAFPWSLALVGLRDVRDYKLASGGAPEGPHSSSPFNIKVESLTLRSFTREEVVELYAEHTGDTGQAFTPEALDRVFELTQGQPWLVNALGYQLIDVVVSGLARRRARSPGRWHRAARSLPRRPRPRYRLAGHLRSPPRSGAHCGAHHHGACHYQRRSERHRPPRLTCAARTAVMRHCAHPGLRPGSPGIAQIGFDEMPLSRVR